LSAEADVIVQKDQDLARCPFNPHIAGAAVGGDATYDLDFTRRERLSAYLLHERRYIGFPGGAARRDDHGKRAHDWGTTAYSGRPAADHSCSPWWRVAPEGRLPSTWVLARSTPEANSHESRRRRRIPSRPTGWNVGAGDPRRPATSARRPRSQRGTDA